VLSWLGVAISRVIFAGSMIGAQQLVLSWLGVAIFRVIFAGSMIGAQQDF